MSFALLVPVDDSRPILVRELSEGATISSQARQLFGGAWEVVRARDLHQPALCFMRPAEVAANAVRHRRRPNAVDKSAQRQHP